MEACTERTQPNIIRTSSVRLITVIVELSTHQPIRHSLFCPSDPPPADGAAMLTVLAAVDAQGIAMSGIVTETVGVHDPISTICTVMISVIGQVGSAVVPGDWSLAVPPAIGRPALSCCAWGTTQSLA